MNDVIRRYPLIYAVFAMSRPLQLLAVIEVYLMGTGIAAAQGHPIELSDVLWGLVALLPISASIHYANEYADYETDALTRRTPFSGGSGALLRTGLAPRVAFKAMWGTLIVGVIVGLLGVSTIGLPALAVLAFGLIFGWMYSLPPLQLGWHGWGELDNALLGGVTLPLYGFAVQSKTIDLNVMLACLPFGLLVFINLLATTWADRDADAQVGKRTLATLWPAQRLRLAFFVGGLLAFVLLAGLGGGVIPPLVARSSLLVIPLVIIGGWAYTRRHSPFPTAAAMVAMLNIQLVTWWLSSANF